jgi:hypothetical protein
MDNALGIVAIVLLGVGALFSLLNFYLSFVSYPFHRLRGRARDDFKWISGVPLIGSFMLWISAVLLQTTSLKWLAIVLSLFDTGGIHWFAGIMLWHKWIKNECPERRD